MSRNINTQVPGTFLVRRTEAARGDAVKMIGTTLGHYRMGAFTIGA